MEESNKVYTKFQSFSSFKNVKKDSLENTKKKIFDIFEKYKNKLNKFLDDDHIKILNTVIKDLNNDRTKNNLEFFTLKENSIAEINTFEDENILIYLVHRYRYEIYPIIKKIDLYPPLVQIEPSSICNFRCVFCFETDKSFTNKKNGFMGTMNLELYKNIIDQISKKVHFVTLASRGEPLVSNKFNEMLEYASDKFLNLKINTNASLLNEKNCHAILSHGVKTVVFSVDAAESELYSKLRVNGNFEQTLNNIKQFIDIKNKHYKKNKIITRISGVKFSNDQQFQDMDNFWSNIVDQVVFVEYNPWENTYDKKPNNLEVPCSDLWRRMFIWWDGKINPCDVDYKSNLCLNNITQTSISDAWNSEKYFILRKEHLEKNRKKLIPCRSCSQI